MGQNSRPNPGYQSEDGCNAENWPCSGEHRHKRRTEKNRSSAGGRRHRKAARKLRKSLPYIALLLAVVYVCMAAKYPDMISRIQYGTIPFASDLQNAAIGTTSYRDPQRPDTSRSRISMDSGFNPGDTVVPSRHRNDEKEPGSEKTQVSRGPHAPTGFEEPTDSTLHNTVAPPHVPAEATKRDSLSPSHEGSTESPTVSPTDVSHSANGARNNMKVSEIDQLDPEEGGENPVIRLPGREKALSAPDQASLEREREGKTAERETTDTGRGQALDSLGQKADSSDKTPDSPDKTPDSPGQALDSPGNVPDSPGQTSGSSGQTSDSLNQSPSTEARNPGGDTSSSIETGTLKEPEIANVISDGAASLLKITEPHRGVEGTIGGGSDVATEISRAEKSEGNGSENSPSGLDSSHEGSISNRLDEREQ